MTMLGRLMLLLTVCGLVVFCILLAVYLIKDSLMWWQVGMPLFCIVGMWIGRELLAAFLDYMLRRARIKARRRDGRVNG